MCIRDRNIWKGIQFHETVCLSIYSLISNLIRSIPIISDNCFDISVFPTPVGPVNKNEPIVLLSSLRPTRDNFIALANVSTAKSWPKITLFKFSSKFLRSFLSETVIFCSGIFVILAIVFSISD